MSNSTRPTIEAFERAIRTNSVVRIDSSARGDAARVRDGKRVLDNKYVLTAVATSLGITNVSAMPRHRLISEIIVRERTLRRFTTEVTPVINGAASTAPAGDNNCATISAPHGLRVVKTTTGAPAGFQPYAIRFTVPSEQIKNKLKSTFQNASNEFRRRSSRQDWLMGALLTAIDAECGCASTETTVKSRLTSDGLGVSKVLLPRTGFQPFTLEFQITTAELNTKWQGVVEYVRARFCGERDWLFEPVRYVNS